VACSVDGDGHCDDDDDADDYAESKLLFGSNITNS
jgi:hypothetical protein